jgi:hypothetical protein
MKAQLLQVLTVGLMTFVMIAPALIVWWRIWHYHQEFVNAQRAVFSADRTLLQPSAIAVTHNGEFSLIHTIKQVCQSITSTPAMPAVLGFMGAVPVGFGLGLWLSDRHQTRRTTMLKQNVAALEKLWQQSLY